MKILPALVLLLLTLSSVALAADTGQDRPNILYIYTDDQSHRSVSCYADAYPFVNTPNIDRLAETGIRFDQAYIGAKCVPSRAGVMTGRFQYATELNGQNVAEDATTHWFKNLRENGYYNGFIGKWHYGKYAAVHGHGISWDWSIVWDHGRYEDAGGYYYDQLVMKHGGGQEPLGGYSTDRYTELTIEFIKERAAEPDKPWFFWLAYAGVHGPYTPADRHQKLYLDQDPAPIPEDVFGPRPDKPVHMQTSTKWKSDASGEVTLQGKTLDFWVKQQMQAVASIDEGVGQILAALEETGQLENTVVIFTSDQGYVWGEHGLKGKISPYAAAIKSPLIISNPTRFPSGKVCSAPVNGMDMVRTFHALSGTEPKTVLHGRDITPLLLQPESEAVAAEWNKNPTMMCYTRNRYDVEGMTERLKRGEWSSFVAMGRGPDTPSPKVHPTYFMLLDGQYKYIRYTYPDRIEELYDLKTDPKELVNLAVDKHYADTLRSFRTSLAQTLTKYDGEPLSEHLPAPKERWKE